MKALQVILELLEREVVQNVRPLLHQPRHHRSAGRPGRSRTGPSADHPYSAGSMIALKSDADTGPLLNARPARTVLQPAGQLGVYDDVPPAGQPNQQELAAPLHRLRDRETSDAIQDLGVLFEVAAERPVRSASGCSQLGCACPASRDARKLRNHLHLRGFRHWQASLVPHPDKNDRLRYRRSSFRRKPESRGGDSLEHGKTLWKWH